MDPSPLEFTRVLAPALRQAAAIARALEGRVANRPKAGEARAAKQALTTADTAAQEALLVPLLEHFPRVGLEAEEDTTTVGRFPRPGRGTGHVVVDPIDGTLHSYLEGEGPYSVLVGLAVGNVYQASLVALPREDLFFEAVRGGGARLTLPDGGSSPAAPEADGDTVLVSHQLPGAVAERLRERGFTVQPASGGAISVAPLLPGVRAGLRIAPEGKDVSVRGRIGVLVAREAGAQVETLGGKPFPESLDAPARALLVASAEADLAALRYAVAAADL